MEGKWEQKRDDRGREGKEPSRGSHERREMGREGKRRMGEMGREVGRQRGGDRVRERQKTMKRERDGGGLGDVGETDGGDWGDGTREGEMWGERGQRNQGKEWRRDGERDEERSG